MTDPDGLPYRMHGPEALRLMHHLQQNPGDHHMLAKMAMEMDEAIRASEARHAHPDSMCWRGMFPLSFGNTFGGVRGVRLPDQPGTPEGMQVLGFTLRQTHQLRERLADLASSM